MKKRSKIIVVVCCVALLISLLAVNCFAFVGASSVPFENYNAIRGIELRPRTDYLASFADDKGWSNVAFDPFWYLDVGSFQMGNSSTGAGTYFLSLTDVGSSGITDPDATLSVRQTRPSYSRYVISLFDVSADEAGVLYGDEMVDPFGGFRITYNDYAFTNQNFVNDGYQWVSGEGTYEASCTVRVLYREIDTRDVDDSYAVVGYDEIYLTSRGFVRPGELFRPFRDTATVVYGNEFVEAVGEWTMKEALDAALSNVALNLPEGVTREYFVEEAYVHNSDVVVDGFGGDIAINAYSRDLNIPRNILPVVPLNVTVKEEVIVKEEVRVEPFEWIMQAMQGVLDTTLFGFITIGHLLMIAIAVPALLAILRAIAGG